MQRQISVTAVALCAVAALAGSVPARAQANTADKAAIEALYQQFDQAFEKKDSKAIMALYAPEVFVYDVTPPRAYVGWDAYKKDWDDLFAAMPGPFTSKITDLSVTVVGNVAYSHYVDDGSLADKDGKATHMVVRATDVWRKVKGKWLIVEEHNSFPVDLATGQADILSKP